MFPTQLILRGLIFLRGRLFETDLMRNFTIFKNLIYSLLLFFIAKYSATKYVTYLSVLYQTGQDNKKHEASRFTNYLTISIRSTMIQYSIIQILTEKHLIQTYDLTNTGLIKLPAEK